jgi:hypothetical protein
MDNVEIIFSLYNTSGLNTDMKLEYIRLVDDSKLEYPPAVYEIKQIRTSENNIRGVLQKVKNKENPIDKSKKESPGISKN